MRWRRRSITLITGMAPENCQTRLGGDGGKAARSAEAAGRGHFGLSARISGKHRPRDGRDARRAVPDGGGLADLPAARPRTARSCSCAVWSRRSRRTAEAVQTLPSMSSARGPSRCGPGGRRPGSTRSTSLACGGSAASVGGWLVDSETGFVMSGEGNEPDHEAARDAAASTLPGRTSGRWEPARADSVDDIQVSLGTPDPSDPPAAYLAEGLPLRGAGPGDGQSGTCPDSAAAGRTVPARLTVRRRPELQPALARRLDGGFQQLRQDHAAHQREEAKLDPGDPQRLAHDDDQGMRKVDPDRQPRAPVRDRGGGQAVGQADEGKQRCRRESWCCQARGDRNTGSASC